MSNKKNILVIGEIAGNTLSPITGELITAASQLAEVTQGETITVLCGESLADAGEQALSVGAKKVLILEDPLLQDFQIGAFVEALEQVVTTVDPAVILIGKTSLGSDIGPRLAFRLNLGMIQDCVDIRINSDTNTLEADRPVYGGASLAKVVVHTEIGLATIRPKSFESSPPDSTKTGSIEKFPIELSPEKATFSLQERIKAKAEGIRLEDARVVIGGGRGLGGSEPFEKLEELAQALGGAVGASRAVCDAGWLPHSYQIGLTGKTISADLYITVAISGASQHLAGISGVKNIVGINKDKEANVFKQARFGVVGDWQNVLPSFIETVHELTG
ncbi:electron transfer flavoprotein subunit alpha/FixB family protein [SAR202 cluster bacterium AD-802-E10_MRT_200m]|nr:electron transfer flavoprotein subunit alpha/FixB family protein [SAR202 cluster bacterium AD-802-E10_MRT_200m]